MGAFGIWGVFCTWIKQCIQSPTLSRFVNAGRAYRFYKAQNEPKTRGSSFPLFSLLLKKKSTFKNSNVGY